MGPGREVAASRLLAAGRRVAVVERELIGGECAYWACMPSKTLLRPTEERGQVDRAAGVDGARLDWPATRDYRDWMIRHLDDAAQVSGYEKQGATVVKGTGRITGPGTVEVDGQILTAEHVIVATGSDAAVPPVDGLDRVPLWTNREATTVREIPDRVVMIGGSAVGCELGQFLAPLQRAGDHPGTLRHPAVPGGTAGRRPDRRAAARRRGRRAHPGAGHRGPPGRRGHGGHPRRQHRGPVRRRGRRRRP
jgi:pyruvate/2-oxoglutarate dehydrogenase complex dihydrolipoamide dehydrogenase (E3) component